MTRKTSVDVHSPEPCCLTLGKKWHKQGCTQFVDGKLLSQQRKNLESFKESTALSIIYSILSEAYYTLTRDEWPEFSHLHLDTSQNENVIKRNGRNFPIKLWYSVFFPLRAFNIFLSFSRLGQKLKSDFH